MARSIYICYFGVREPLVQTQVIPYLRELVKGGHSITLLTFEPAAVAENEMVETWEDERRKMLADQGIEWKWLRYHKRPTVPATFFDVVNGARVVRKMMRRERIDILHARAHVPAVMAALARKGMSYRSELLFDIRGFVPEEYTDGGIWPEGGWLYRTVKRIERWLMRESDGFVVLTEKARQILFPSENSALSIQHSALENPKSKIQNPKSDSRPVEVIPCCVDLKRFESATHESRMQIRSRLGVDGRTVLTYVGAFGGWYMTSETADLFGAAKERDGSTFALILTQSKPELIEPLLRERGYTDGDYLITRVRARDMAGYLSGADLAVSFLRPSYSKLASSPTKNAEYLACGLPIITNFGTGDVDNILIKNKVGVLVREFSHAAYLDAFDEIERLGDIGDHCREVARREFDLETVGGDRYRHIYARMLDSDRSG